MAIYNGRILMRKGNEADFDASKLMSGEWAVSLDAGIVRICLEAGKVIRMATYEAFEEDMKQIEAILLECQSIEEAVRRINTEVSEKLNACAEYVQQAKNYSEQAKTSEANAKSYMQSASTSVTNAKTSENNAKTSELNAKASENNAKLSEESAREVFESIPEDYSTISNDLYELAIKETASGEEIHVNDSSNLKLREFALYGKAKQNTTSGNQLFDAHSLVKNNNDTLEVSDDGYIVTVSGGSKAVYSNSYCNLDVELLRGRTIYLSLDSITKTNEKAITTLQIIITKADDSKAYYPLNASLKEINVPEDAKWVQLNLYSNNSSSLLDEANVSVYKGVIVSFVQNAEWEEYSGGMASPNPQYPQPIEVSGESGRVAVKSCGKNLFNKTAPYKRGVTFDDNGNETTGNSNWAIHEQYIKVTPLTDYTISGNIVPKSWNVKIACYDINKNPIITLTYKKTSDVIVFNVPEDVYYIRTNYYWEEANLDIIQIEKGVATEYEPYKETLSTIPTENGLAGIKVSSGGNNVDKNGQEWLSNMIVKYADGSGERIQRIAKLSNPTFSLEKGYALETSELFSCIAPNSYSKNNALLSTIVCNKLQFLRSVLSNDICGAYQGYEKIFARITGVTTAEEFNALMVDSEIYYILAEPIITPLTAEEIAEIEKLHTFYPVTNISNDFDCGMKVTYYCDSKNYIGNQLAIMKQEQEEAMMNMLLLMPTEVQAMMIENDTNDLLKESEI